MQEIQEMQVRALGQEGPLEEEMATHSSILTWKIPWTEKPGGLESMGLQRVGHDWARAHARTHTHTSYPSPAPHTIHTEHLIIQEFKLQGKIISRNGQHNSWGNKERLCFLIHSFNYLLSTYCVSSTVVGTKINEQDSEYSRGFLITIAR